jgi:hypothetical protein
MKHIKSIIIIASISAFALACSSESNKNDDKAEELQDITVDEDNEQFKNEFKSAIEELPSPLEISQFISSTGAAYMAEVLNPYTNVENYSSTNHKKALNLGVYAADLGYSCVYYNVPDVLQFMNASKRLSEELGITGAFGQEKIAKFEQSVTDRDSLIKVVTENIYMADNLLIQNDKLDIATLVLAGSWVEGLYISTSIVKNYPRDIPEEFVLQILNPIITEISNQGNTLEILLEIMNKFPDNQHISELVVKLQELKAVYSQIESAPAAEEVNDMGVEAPALDKESLGNITKKITSIRSQIIS